MLGHDSTKVTKDVQHVPKAIIKAKRALDGVPYGSKC